jgi:hypothetical protein
LSIVILNLFQRTKRTFYKTTTHTKTCNNVRYIHYLNIENCIGDSVAILYGSLISNSIFIALSSCLPFEDPQLSNPIGEESLEEDPFFLEADTDAPLTLAPLKLLKPHFVAKIRKVKRQQKRQGNHFAKVPIVDTSIEPIKNSIRILEDRLFDKESRCRLRKKIIAAMFVEQPKPLIHKKFK